MVLRPNPSDARADQLARRKAAADTAFFREVDDAVRHDDMADAFKRYAVPGAIVIVLVLAALAGFLWWRAHQAAAVAARNESLVTALDHVDAGNLGAADAALAPLGTRAGDGLGGLARLTRAAIAEQRGGSADAARLFAAVAADASLPKPLRDLATVRAVAAGFDATPATRVIAQLKPLAIPGDPWFGNAGELLGMAYLKQNQPALAGPLFAAIARDARTPQSLRRRARQLAGLLGVDAIDDVARPSGGQPGDDDQPGAPQ